MDALKNNATFIKDRFKRSILTTPVRLNFLDSRLKLILHHFLKVHKSIQSIDFNFKGYNHVNLVESSIK
ncbi:hypothetical protein Syun_027730 [Stephania yunnanensis]|uniref:Uncharacterized protein n=1 Tax=Stephania yunnanensis TaxID=152371 RepID=A0AAP0HN29_9MAGN